MKDPKEFAPGGLIPIGDSGPVSSVLTPDQCVIKMVDDKIVCLRGLGPHHPKHDPKAPIGATRKMIEQAIGYNEKERRERT